MLRFFFNGGQIPDDARKELWVLRTGRTQKEYINAVWTMRAQERPATQRRIKSRGNWPFMIAEQGNIVFLATEKHNAKAKRAGKATP